MTSPEKMAVASENVPMTEEEFKEKASRIGREIEDLFADLKDEALNQSRYHIDLDPDVEPYLCKVLVSELRTYPVESDGVADFDHSLSPGSIKVWLTKDGKLAFEEKGDLKENNVGEKIKNYLKEKLGREVK